MLRYRSVMARARGAAVPAGAVLLAAALAFGPVAGADPGSPGNAAPPAADGIPACCAEALPEAAPDPAHEAAPEGLVVQAADVHPGPAMLPVGVVSEQGLQIKTILAARAISAEFPQIRSMIGVRPDAKPWHPSGLALDLMIPNPGSAEGIALGDAILAYALRNAARFGVQDVIWRGTYFTPAGPSGSGYGHYDHVHITTTGGGYPGGGEEYPAEG